MCIEVSREVLVAIGTLVDFFVITETGNYHAHCRSGGQNEDHIFSSVPRVRQWFESTWSRGPQCCSSDWRQRDEDDAVLVQGIASMEIISAIDAMVAYMSASETVNRWLHAAAADEPEELIIASFLKVENWLGTLHWEPDRDWMDDIQGQREALFDDD